jgi:hypothetical protein
MDIKLLAPMTTFIGICVSVFLWHMNQKRKALSYAILWRRPLLNLKGIAREHMDILFRGQKVSESELIVIRIFNSGHLPINTGDYQTNLAIELEPGASIIDVNIIETVPANLEERLKVKSEGSPLIEAVEPARILLRQVLLNDGDSLTVQLLVLNSHGRVTVSGHVQGIRSVKPWKESRLLPTLLTQVGALVMAFAMLGVQPSDIVSLAFTHLLPFFLTFLLGYVCLSAGLYWPRKTQSQFA